MLKTLETGRKTLEAELDVETYKAPWKLYLNQVICNLQIYLKTT